MGPSRLLHRFEAHAGNFAFHFRSGFGEDDPVFLDIRRRLHGPHIDDSYMPAMACYICDAVEGDLLLRFDDLGLNSWARSGITVIPGHILCSQAVSPGTIKCKPCYNS